MAFHIHGRPVIVLGDKTTHGGAVISASPTFSYMGKKVARVGDQVSCPVHGVNEIIEGAETAFDQGNLIALHDCLTACGARLIADSSDVASKVETEETVNCTALHYRIALFSNLSGFGAFVEAEKIFGAGTASMSKIPKPGMSEEDWQRYQTNRKRMNSNYQDDVEKYKKHCVK